ncbi:hypothetical protein [Synechococcus sp. PCC 7336]|uniref:hypothetical protein n=1 Tax=Synechococcus sp. PCC 7336 TaxID=195250 RepID=UPI00034CD6C9|nr:hypothetical protein [Synechococcus sp. PCC 7336]
MSPPIAVPIEPVRTPEDLDAFLDLPARVYRGDRHWVPALRSSIAKQFEDSNPFLRYGQMQPFLALLEGKPVGRVVASVNERLNEREGKTIGLFGFFECIDQLEVARALLEAAAGWLRDRGARLLRGPIDFSTHNNCLFLVEGFDSPPHVMMPYNPAYYPSLMAQLGWTEAKDAYAYHLPLDRPLDDKFAKGYRIACKAGVTFRPIHLKGDAFIRDCRSLYQLFTTAFVNNWSSSARTEAEFLEEAQDLQSLVDRDIFWIAEDKSQMVGFFMGLPDYNIPLKQVNGRLNWLGILKFLWYRRQIDRARIIAICSLPDYRRKMVPLALIHLGMTGGTGKRKPYRTAELSWVYEDNWSSRKVIEATGATIYKTYRIYERAV